MTGWIDLSNEEIYPDVIACIPGDVARKYMILPLRMQGDLLVVGVADPSDDEFVEKLRFILNHRIAPVGVPLSQLKFAIWRFYGPEL